MSTCFSPYETRIGKRKKRELRKKYRSVVVNGQEYWFVPRLPQPLPIPPGGPKVVKPPPYEIPYTLSRSSPQGILESRIQPSVNDLHQTLFSVELTDGNLTVPQGVNITAQEHFDIAQTGAYKVVAESYILGGRWSLDSVV